MRNWKRWIVGMGGEKRPDLIRAGGLSAPTPCVLFLIVLATGLLAQEKPQYTFGTTVVSTSGLQGRVYLLKKNISKLPRFDSLKSAGTIYTNTLNVWPQRFDEGFPGISDRFEWFAIDYTARFWIDNAGQYRFSLLSDDGARLSIDNEELIDNDGIHAASALSASAFLSSWHPYDARILLPRTTVHGGTRTGGCRPRRDVANLQHGRLHAAQRSGRMGHREHQRSAALDPLRGTLMLDCAGLDRQRGA